MSLLLPDTGLLVWMVIIFAIVFFVLAKFGFPIITGMVERRSAHIEESLREAEVAREQVASLEKEKVRMLEQARLEQGRILREASESRDAIIAKARDEAAAEASKVFDDAKRRIDAERENALSDIRQQVAALSVAVAGKVVRKELSDASSNADFLDSLLGEASRAELDNRKG